MFPQKLLYLNLFEFFYQSLYFLQICYHNWVCSCKGSIGLVITINTESLKLEIAYALNLFANLSLTINASYSTLLFEALNPNWKECSIHYLFGLFSRILAYDPFSFEESSMHKLHTSARVFPSCSYRSDIANSTMNSAKLGTSLLSSAHIQFCIS